MKNTMILLATFAAAVTINDVAKGDDPSGVQQPVELHAQIDVQMNYLLYLPKDYESQDSWPLVLFLHGAGERGDDLNLVKTHGPPKLIEQGKDFPFIVVSPQCPRERQWEPLELSALLDDVIARHKVDEDRIYVTGLSMGGFGTWRLAAYSPERFAAIAPICGGGEVYWTRRLTHLPVWVFHGAKDQSVPLERSQQMVDALERNGGNVKLTIYPDAGHDSWTQTYDDPEFYKWLLSQRRKQAE